MKCEREKKLIMLLVIDETRTRLASTGSGLMSANVTLVSPLPAFSTALTSTMLLPSPAIVTITVTISSTTTMASLPRLQRQPPKSRRNIHRIPTQAINPLTHNIHISLQHWEPPVDWIHLPQPPLQRRKGRILRREHHLTCSDWDANCEVRNRLAD